MNKRLLLALYDRSGLGAYMPVDYNGHELEVEKHMDKFAELIVRECANFLDENSGYDDCNNAWHPEPEDLLEHFGVDKE